MCTFRHKSRFDLAFEITFVWFGRFERGLPRTFGLSGRFDLASKLTFVLPSRFKLAPEITFVLKGRCSLTCELTFTNKTDTQQKMQGIGNGVIRHTGRLQKRRLRKAGEGRGTVNGNREQVRENGLKGSNLGEFGKSVQSVGPVPVFSPAIPHSPFPIPRFIPHSPFLAFHVFSVSSKTKAAYRGVILTAGVLR